MKTNRIYHKGGVRAIALATLFSVVAAGASAKPARRGPVSVTQPDGTTLTIRLEGDEFRHATFTEDGYPLLFDDNLGYVYADVRADGTLSPTSLKAKDISRRSAAERTFLSSVTAEKVAASRLAMTEAAGKVRSTRSSAPKKGPGLCSTTFPLTGEQKGLVILVEYTDVKFGSSNSLFKYEDYSDGGAHQYFSDMLNKEGFDGCGATGSCRDWFLDNSRNSDGVSQFIPTFDVYGPVTLPNNMRYYGGNQNGSDKNPQKMAIHACQLLDDEIDFAQYDRDGDGYVDNIYIFYAGLGEADGGTANTVWPHSWDISAAENTVYRFDGKIIDHYACSNETDAVALRPDGVGTFVHEFSHVMGLPDLYPTNNSSAYTPGEYSVLDYGPYNNNGRTPPNYSAYERYALGWLEPKEYGAEDLYSLPNIAESNEAYIVKTEKQNEYFLVENRQQSGWDSFIPGHGMLIWHVDFVRSVFDKNIVNNTSSHQYVDLVEANNRQAQHLAAGHPFPGTNKVDSYTFKSWSRRDTGVSFTGITEDPSTGLISKTAVNTNYDPSAVGEIAVDTDSADVEYYNMQGIRVAEPAKGQLLIRRQGDKATKIIF